MHGILSGAFRASIIFYLFVLAACGGSGGGSGNNSGGGSPPTSPDPNPIVATLNALHVPIAVVDREGNRTVLWADNTPSNISYFMSRYDGTTWGSPNPIFTNKLSVTAFDVYAYQGKLVVAWAERTLQAGEAGVLYSSSYTPATGWTAPLEIVTPSTRIEKVKIVDDGAGNLTVVWVQWQGTVFGDFDLWSSHKLATDLDWSTPDLRDNDLFDAINVHLGIDGSGALTLIWRQAGALYFERYVAGIWQGEQPFAATGSDVSVAVSQKGDIIAAWRQVDAGQNVLYTRRFTSGAWEAAVQQTTNSNTVEYGPWVAVNDTGGALVLWQFDGTFPNSDPLKALRYTGGGGWGSIADVRDSVSITSMKRDVSLTNAGAGIIALRSNNSDLVAYEYETNSGWSAEQPLYSASPRVLWEPAVAQNTAGVGVIAWTEQTASGYQIRARLLN